MAAASPKQQAELEAVALARPLAALMASPPNQQLVVVEAVGLSHTMLHPEEVMAAPVLSLFATA
jgi:hypothetical protein